MRINDCIATLGLADTDGVGEVKKKYRELAKKYHPDTGGNEEQFRSVEQAYRIVSEAMRKAGAKEVSWVKEQKSTVVNQNIRRYAQSERADTWEAVFIKFADYIKLAENKYDVVTASDGAKVDLQDCLRRHIYCRDGIEIFTSKFKKVCRVTLKADKPEGRKIVSLTGSCSVESNGALGKDETINIMIYDKIIRADIENGVCRVKFKVSDYVEVDISLMIA